MTIQTAHSHMVKTLAKPGEDIIAGLTRTKLDQLLTAAQIVVAATRLLDQAKRFAIYGKEIDMVAERKKFIEQLSEISASYLVSFDKIPTQVTTAKGAHLLHMAIGVAGEGGELLEAFLRSCILTNNLEHIPLDMPNVIEELGDIEFFIEGLRQPLDISRDETLDANLNKLTKGKNARYKDGKYSDAAAQARADKQASANDTKGEDQ